MASRGSRPAGQGSARRLALPFAVAVAALPGCGNGEAGKPWIGVQECRVGIPPEDTSHPEAIPQVSIPLTSVRFYQTGDGFYLQNFTVGPIAGFSCESVPFQVTVRYATSSPVVLGLAGSSGTLGTPGSAMGGGSASNSASSSRAAARPPLARPVVMDPFECRATDGRSYILSGTGAADLQSMFVDMTFSAWLPDGQGQATLLCTTRYLQVSSVPDAGEPAPGVELAPFPGEGDGTPPVEEGLPPEGTANPTEAQPDAGG